MKSPRSSQALFVLAFVALCFSFANVADARSRTNQRGVTVQSENNMNLWKKARGGTTVNQSGVAVTTQGAFNNPRSYIMDTQSVDGHGVVVERRSRFRPVEGTKRVVRAPFNFVFGND